MRDLVDPDMPAQQLRLHMGEVTAQEMRTARAAIRWANSAAQARIEAVRTEALDALRPFATYMEGGLDRDSHGDPLPDEQGVGWIYLTQGDFRRAAAAIRALTEAKEGRT